MVSTFWIKTGLTHILDFQGYDHMLFLWVTFLGYTAKDFKSILWKTLAFTVAHSLSLALSTFDFIIVDSKWIEVLIAASILFSAATYFFNQKREALSFKVQIIIVVVFGLIHGVGFSGLLKSLLGKGNELITPLFSFNIGLEMGQLLFILPIILLHSYLFRKSESLQKTYNTMASIIGMLISLVLIITRV